MADIVHRVILGMENESRRGVLADMVERIALQAGPGPKMAGVESDAEVRTAAKRVGGVDRLVAQRIGVADSGDEMSACRGAEHTNLARVDTELFRARSQENHCTLRVLQRHWHFRELVTLAGLVPMVPRPRHPKFENRAC